MSGSRPSTTWWGKSRGRINWIEAEGRLVYHSAPYRYLWPSELDLMARITGFRLQERWAGWDRAPFTLRQPEPGRRVRETAVSEDGHLPATVRRRTGQKF